MLIMFHRTGFRFQRYITFQYCSFTFLVMLAQILCLKCAIKLCYNIYFYYFWHILAIKRACKKEKFIKQCTALYDIAAYWNSSFKNVFFLWFRVKERGYGNIVSLKCMVTLCHKNREMVTLCLYVKQIIVFFININNDVIIFILILLPFFDGLILD